jgi:ATP adenylyltransferase
MNPCPFCTLNAERILMEKDGLRVIADAFPVTDGHLLILPARHMTSFREMSEQEWRGVYDLIREWTERLQSEDATIAGFNIGINDGEVAGQTVMHAHVHLIPRRPGDVSNPRGGVRGVIPGRADYRAEA